MSVSSWSKHAEAVAEHQEFNYAGPCGENGFLEDYYHPMCAACLLTLSCWSPLTPTGETQHVVVNHRPRSAMLQFSRLMLETFSGTPYAKHWEGTP